jgi:hypothetical protein
MPFRAFAPPLADPPEGPTPSPFAERSSPWRTSLLLLTSAALGGIAVAIWNRRTLALMRQQTESPPLPGADE